MSHELREGTKLKSVCGPGDPNHGGYFYAKVGTHGCNRIVVSEQPGQMGMVPWALCEFAGGKVTMANLALMETVDLDDSGE